MTKNTLLDTLKQNPTSVDFQTVMDVIEQTYHFTAQPFRNGELNNQKNENNGSCKIFAFAMLNQLTEQQTLHCFGDYYRQDVLNNPKGNDHQNIRNFMQTGWAGIEFEGQALSEK